MSPYASTHTGRHLFSPPRYLAPLAAGIQVTDGRVKIAVLDVGAYGLELTACNETLIPSGALKEGRITDRVAIARAVRPLARTDRIRFVNTSLPDELAEEVSVVEESLRVFDKAGVVVRSIERELSAIARTILIPGNRETVLVIDIGKAVTRFGVVSARVPQSVATLAVGGHALTRAVQKYSSITEKEAQRLKTEQGIIASAKEIEYQADLLHHIDRIRDGAARHLVSWQARAAALARDKVTYVLLVGDDASMRGLPEHLTESLGMPVLRGDVFTNLAPRDSWLPPVDYHESLGYATAIGLALKDYEN